MKLYVQFSVSVPCCSLLTDVCFLSVNPWKWNSVQVFDPTAAAVWTAEETALKGRL